MRTLAALLFISFVAFAQSPDTKKCSVDGSVVNAVTGAPSVRAHVSVVGANDSALADSDTGGKWRIEHMDCGRVTIAVNRPGFLRLQQSDLLLVANTPQRDVKL